MLFYASGIHQAFEVLLKRHERGVYNFIMRSTGSSDISEDLTQEVFMRVIRSAPKYKKSADGVKKKKIISSGRLIVAEGERWFNSYNCNAYNMCLRRPTI